MLPRQQDGVNKRELLNCQLRKRSIYKHTNLNSFQTAHFKNCTTQPVKNIDMKERKQIQQKYLTPDIFGLGLDV